MKYNRPDVVALGLALCAVQHVNKEPVQSTDSFELQFTTGAYEADE
jgi:hypothetical protein